VLYGLQTNVCPGVSSKKKGGGVRNPGLFMIRGGKKSATGGRGAWRKRHRMRRVRLIQEKSSTGGQD